MGSYYYNHQDNYHYNYYYNYYGDYDCNYYQNYQNYGYQQPPAHESALAIPSIIHQILSYSSVTDLKQKRQVCRQWNEEGCKVIRRKLRLQFVTYYCIKSYTLRFHNHKDFCESFYLGPEICLEAPIVQQFLTDFHPHIRSLEILSSSPVKLSTLRQIMCTLLPNLEDLSLTNKMEDDLTVGTMVDDTLSELKKLVPAGYRYLPKLKRLLFINTNDNQVDSKVLESLLQEIFMAAQNLEEIGTLRKKKIGPDLSLKKVTLSAQNLKAIDEVLDRPSALDCLIWSTIMQCSKMTKLKRIGLGLKMKTECVQTLVAKRFPLTSIDLSILPNCSNKCLEMLFNSLKETLVHIKLRYCVHDTTERAEFELDLPITTKLSLVRSIDLEGFQGSLRFIENVPNLTELTMRRVNFNKVVLKDADCPLKPEGINVALQSLKVYEDYSNNNRSNRQRSIQTVQKLGQQFPCVRILRLEKIVDESLCLIYAQWSNLENLEIVEGLFTDSGTTAIHPNAYKVILREEAYEKFNVEALRQGIFIGNLTKLTTLKIHSPNITDVTLILGVLQCPKIRSISVQSYKITDTALYRIINNPNIMELKTEHCNELTRDAVKFVQKKMEQRGGTASLNEYKGPMDVYHVRDFLRKNSKLMVLLKRLNCGPQVKALETKIPEKNVIIKKCSVNIKTVVKSKTVIRSNEDRRPHRTCPSIFKRFV